MRSSPPGQGAPTSFSRAGMPWVTWPATNRPQLGSSWKPSSLTETPLTSTVRSSVRFGSRSDTTAQDPPPSLLVVAVWVVVAPCCVEVKSSLVASNVIDVGATTSMVLRPASPTP